MIRAGVVALLATAVAVFAVPAPSMADDDYYNPCFASWVSCQTGVKVSYPAGVCGSVSATYGATTVCVDYVGDYVYVEDNDADTHSAMAFIANDNGDVLDRYCRNPHGAGSWARCNFDWAESGYKRVHGGIRTSYTSMLLAYRWQFANN
ncbi:hypothetical protein WEI85_22975 [Actinomycetes bacterium KLBMP 9797]